jgi:hypothetical protein
MNDPDDPCQEAQDREVEQTRARNRAESCSAITETRTRVRCVPAALLPFRSR